MENRTTLQVENTTLEKLKELKIHPNQSYDELIKNILIEVEKRKNART